MNKEQFIEYAKLKVEASAIKERLDALAPILLDQMLAVAEDAKVETTFGTYNIAKVKDWTYPDYVTLAEQEFKAVELRARQTGDATWTEKPSLRFRTARNGGAPDE